MVSERKLANMLGTVEVTYQISRNEKLASRMYMGVWSLWSQCTAQMIEPLPMRVRRKTRKKSTKRRTCPSLGPGKPRRMKPVMVLELLKIFMGL